MTTSSTVYSVARGEVAGSGRPALLIRTTLPRRERAIYIEPIEPEPALGAPISWDDHHDGHATVGGRRVRKFGYAFDPDAPLG